MRNAECGIETYIAISRYLRQKLFHSFGNFLRMRYYSAAPINNVVDMVNDNRGEMAFAARGHAPLSDVVLSLSMSTTIV